MAATSLIIPRRMVGTISVEGTLKPLRRRTNGKVTFQGTTSFIGHKCGTRCDRARKPRLFGRFGIRRWRSMNGGPVLHRLLFQSNVCSAYLTPMNRSKHKFWDCIQARCAWRWATYIMHELCGVRTGNYDCFNWKQATFGERIPKRYGKMVKIWHLLRGITLWTIWVERNDKVFNQVQWHESKVKQQMRDALIIYAKMAWKRVLEQSKISDFSKEAMLHVFDKTWGARGVLCRRNDLHMEWNWRRLRR